MVAVFLIKGLPTERAAFLSKGNSELILLLSEIDFNVSKAPIFK